jgi:guanylate kinase
MPPVHGNLFVVSAPSGAGKTSLVQAVITQLSNVAASVSYTTRARRPNEENGKDYFFVGEDEFREMISRDEFIEYAEVFGNLYGTSKAEITRLTNQGTDVLLEIDWQGARSIRRSHPDTRSIFILPPSNMTLRERLIGRAGDDPQVIEQRMQAAVGEMSHYEEYEFLIINDDFERASQEFAVIVRACRLSTENQKRTLGVALNKLIASEDSI